MTPRTQSLPPNTRAQRALVHSETRYRRLFEAARDGILILDAASGTIADANPFMESDLAASRLKLEITESLIMENAEAALAVITQLRELGVETHIDDFGTGYSSLSYLHSFPVDTLKIDRSFISRIGDGAGDAEIVSTIVGLAHSLHMAATAEGVETEEQLVHLRALHCEYGQGHYFSKPVRAELAGELIAH